jgi:hypothetical protein
MGTPVANLDPRVNPAADPTSVFKNTDMVIALTAFSAADEYHEYPGASLVPFSPSSFLKNQLALSRYAKLAAETSVFRERCIGQFITMPISSVAGCAVASPWFRVLHLSAPKLITLISGTKWYIQSCTILHESMHAYGCMGSSSGVRARVQWIFRYPYIVRSVGVVTNTMLPLRQGEEYSVVGYHPEQHDVGCGTHVAIYTHRQRDGRADGCTLDPAFMRSMGLWGEGDADEDICGWRWEEEDMQAATNNVWDTDPAEDM